MEQSPAEIELAKIKAQNKARQAKYLEKRRAEGKRHLSAMVSGETYDKLCRLRDQSIRAGEPKNLGQILDELLSGSEQDSADHQTEEPATPKPAENQMEMFDESDLSDKATIIKAMAEYRAVGDTWQAVVDKLNEHDIPTARGEAWTKANAQAFYSRNK